MKIHWRVDSEGGPLLLAACGWGFADKSHFTTERTGVTCKVCIRELPEPAPYNIWPCTPLQEHEIQERPPWLTWRHALREYVRRMDDGSPLKSPAHPARFEAIPEAFQNRGEGDMGQRQAERLAPVGKAIATLPPALNLLGTHIVLKYVIEHVCGAVRVEGTGPKAAQRKQRIVNRYPIPIQSVAERMSFRVGRVVTTPEMQGFVAMVGSHINAHLHARQLIAHVEEDMPSIGKYDLDGWGAIAAALGVSKSAAINWANKEHDPLPVSKFGTKKVTASSAEIDAWISRNTTKMNST